MRGGTSATTIGSAASSTTRSGAEVRQVVLYAQIVDAREQQGSQAGRVPSRDANQHLVLDTYGHVPPGADREGAGLVGQEGVEPPELSRRFYNWPGSS
jgi:hypothetical protein